jgi:DNA-binding transcriptional ArsR family regulator
MKEIVESKIEELQKLLVLNRIRILEILYVEDTCVCQMVKKIDIKHNLISHHLKTLQGMGYIKSKRNGQHMIYIINEEKRSFVKELLNLLKK